MINQWLRGWEEEGGGLGLPPTCPHILYIEEKKGVAEELQGELLEFSCFVHLGALGESRVSSL